MRNIGIINCLCLEKKNKWLGYQDSNLGMAGSKPAALPLGYTPILFRKKISSGTGSEI